MATDIPTTGGNTLLSHAKFGPRTTKLLTAYAIGSSVYRTGHSLLSKRQDKQRYRVTVGGADESYDDLHEWILNQLPEEKRRALIARTSRSNDDWEAPAVVGADAENPKKPGYVRLNYDSAELQKIVIGGHQVTVLLQSQDKPTVINGQSDQGFMRSFQSLVFTTQSAAGRDAILDLMESLAEIRYSRKRVPAIRTVTKWGNWQFAASSRPRRWDSLILADGIAEKVDDDLKTFLASEAKYERRSIPWHRGYLFHGPAGTGKTSLVRALATRYDLDLWCIPLNDLDQDSSLMNLVCDINKGGILLLEDVDVFAAATKREAENKEVSLSALLNALDGAATPHGLITMMTTNHLSAIDHALYRPGRIDCMVELGDADWAQVIRMWEEWYETSALDHHRRVHGTMEGRLWNPAKVQQIMRNCENPEEAIEKLRQGGQ